MAFFVFLFLLVDSPSVPSSHTHTHTHTHIVYKSENYKEPVISNSRQPLVAFLSFLCSAAVKVSSNRTWHGVCTFATMSAAVLIELEASKAIQTKPKTYLHGLFQSMQHELVCVCVCVCIASQKYTAPE